MYSAAHFRKEGALKKVKRSHCYHTMCNVFCDNSAAVEEV